MTARITDWRAHGIRVTHAVAEFEESGLHRAHSDEDMVRLHFGLRGDYRVRYPQLDRSYELVGGHHNVFYTRTFDLEFVNKTLCLETFGIQFPTARFIEYIDGSSDHLSRFCERVARGDRGMLFEEWSGITPALHQAIQQMLECRFEGKVKDLFVLSKSLEILVLAIEAATQRAPGPHLRSNADRDKVVAARDAMNERLADPPSLSELARLVGLNEYKLKRGFKEMFGSTVFGYLTEQRLELARRQLLDTDKTAAEVGFALGYATPQHFSHAFKRRFGVSPNSVRKNP